MTRITVQLPDRSAERLQALARSRGLTMNELIEALTAQAVANADAEARFRRLAAGADREAARAILDRSDGDDRRSG